MYSLTIEGRSHTDLAIKLGLAAKEFTVNPRGTEAPTATEMMTQPEVYKQKVEKVEAPRVTHEEMQEAEGASTFAAAHAVKETVSIDTNPESEKDVNGLYWDKRVHSSSRGKVKDGSWKKRKGVNPELYRTVMAELVGAVNAAPLTPVPAVPASPVMDPATVAMSAPVEPTPLVAPTPHIQEGNSYTNLAVPDSTKPAHTFATFKENVVPTIATLMKEGKLTQEYLGQLKEYFGVGELFEVFANDQQMAELYANFCEAGLITKVD